MSHDCKGAVPDGKRVVAYSLLPNADGYKAVLSNEDGQLDAVSQQTKTVSFKKVTFGTEKEAIVQTFIYDQALSTDKDDFCDTNDPLVEPNLIRVTAVQSSLPRCIPPPVDVRHFEAALGPEQQLGISVLTPLYTSSPKKMTSEADNPFRPDGSLCHEVDPIVKQYAKKPFPDHLEDSTFRTMSEVVPTYGAEQKDGQILYSPRLAEVDPKLTIINGEELRVAEAQHNSVASPKAGTLEVVHVEPRKKKCLCCTIQ